MSGSGAAQPLSRRYPALLPAAIAVHRTRRSFRWWREARSGRVVWAAERRPDPWEHEVAAHASPLVRVLAPADLPLQLGKVTNLRLAASLTDGLVIGPGETFSFNRVVGNATRRRGFVDGMRISAGSPVAGVGGGLCQLANLIHWLVLHSSLTVVERSEHSLDLFPDQDRVVPWGVGCTIVYNYVDLVIRNDTPDPVVLRTWLDDTHLHGTLSTTVPAPGWRVEARDESFVADGDDVVRRNELWRVRTDATGTVEELIRRNSARVAYPVPAELLG